MTGRGRAGGNERTPSKTNGVGGAVITQVLGVQAGVDRGSMAFLSNRRDDFQSRTAGIPSGSVHPPSCSPAAWNVVYPARRAQSICVTTKGRRGHGTKKRRGEIAGEDRAARTRQRAAQLAERDLQGRDLWESSRCGNEVCVSTSGIDPRSGKKSRHKGIGRRPSERGSANASVTHVARGRATGAALPPSWRSP